MNQGVEEEVRSSALRGDRDSDSYFGNETAPSGGHSTLFRHANLSHTLFASSPYNPLTLLRDILHMYSASTKAPLFPGHGFHAMC